MEISICVFFLFGGILLWVMHSLMMRRYVHAKHRAHAHAHSHSIVHPCCEQCSSPRLAITRPISVGKERIKDQVFAQVGPILPNPKAPTELTCLRCGHIWKEQL